MGFIMQKAIADFNPVAAKGGKFTLAAEWGWGGEQRPEERQ